MLRKNRGNTRRQVGDKAEALARQHLTANGYTIIAENFNCRLGELDCVAIPNKLSGKTHDPCLVIVEVRARSSTAYGSASATVDYNKQKKLIKATSVFLQQHAQYQDYGIRFDVFGVDLNTQTIEWVKDAFRADD